MSPGVRGDLEQVPAPSENWLKARGWLESPSVDRDAMRASGASAETMEIGLGCVCVREKETDRQTGKTGSSTLAATGTEAPGTLIVLSIVLQRTPAWNDLRTSH